MSLVLSRMLLDRFFPGAGGVVAGEARPPMDWRETPVAHVFEMDLPGLAKDQVAVEVVDGHILRVRAGGEHEDANNAAKAGKASGEEEEENDGVRWHCRERAAGRRRAADEASARMADGVLTVTVPKRKGKKRHAGNGKAAGDDKPVCCRFWP
ncbi:Os02g0711300 [Oryza sativa Japonica Group]|uniref:Isoform 2 of 17.8 kDa heat shock protein n=1 Tax=Oryza sativa subsp. japonica TaxID=39947 RepID=Q0DY72-2|nr:Os02g0711300 [Oryza sativa Japonica Group]BAS80569.1 Os02g0711300 [Oryza sativa Japonica Group]|eukprot:NP_001047902.1 Os02g0711300 [Oryza sativa Japonica Group]